MKTLHIGFLAGLIAIIFASVAALITALHPPWVDKALDQALYQYPDHPLVRQLGEQFNRPLALQFKLRESEQSSVHWLQLSRQVGNFDGEAAFELAQYFKGRNQHQQAALWLEQAIALKHPEAIKMQALTLIRKQNYGAAKSLIAALDSHSETFFFLNLHLSIAQEQGSAIQLNFNRLAQLNAQHPMVLAVRRYGINDYWQQIGDHYSIAQGCSTSVQLYASSLDNLNRLNDLGARISRESFISQQFCFYPPKYIPKSKLNCSNSESERLACNKNVLAELTEASQADYIGVLADNGKANVNHGVLYLDREDDEHVFKHELLHLIGFIDEYPVPKHHQVCQVDEFSAVAKNIVVDAMPRSNFNSERQARRQVLGKVPWRALIKPSTPITHIVDGVRVLGTPAEFQDDVGLFAAQTCDNQARASFKPLHSWGTMRYNSLPLSHVYQQIHALNPGKFAMKRHIQ